MCEIDRFENLIFKIKEGLHVLRGSLVFVGIVIGEGVSQKV